MISVNTPKPTDRSSPYCVIWARRDYLRYLNLRRLKPRLDHNKIQRVKIMPHKEGADEPR